MQRARTSNKKTSRMSAIGTKAVPTAVEEEIVFADEYARTAWEVGQAVANITASLPPEDQNLGAQTIAFEPRHLSRGTYAIFFSGTVIGTDREGVFLVPERSLNVLERLGIPYHSA